jgi:hypothetical protein
MKKILFLALICLGLQSYAVRAEDSLQIVRYVNAMARYAVSEMHRSGVPASVSLAQGILETAAGTSPLYSRSNNNFGIKCKANWSGPYTLHDDDAQGECFRVYDNDSMSYVDHSNFLRTAPRYNFLFQLDKTDYRGWAIGLKKAGYATNPKYSMKLIEYIERYNLDAYDHLTVAQLSSSPRLARNASQALNASRQAAVINLPKSTAAASTPATPASAPTTSTKNANTPVNGFDPNNLPEVHWNVTNIPDGDASHVAYKPKPKPKCSSKTTKHSTYNKKASTAKKGTHTVNSKSTSKTGSKAPVKTGAKTTTKPVAKSAANAKPVAKKAPVKKK